MDEREHNVWVGRVFRPLPERSVARLQTCCHLLIDIQKVSGCNSRIKIVLENPRNKLFSTRVRNGDRLKITTVMIQTFLGPRDQL